MNENTAFRPSERLIAAALGALLFVALIYFLRPLGIIHEPLMYLYKYPLVWFAPLVAFPAVFAAGYAISYARNAARIKREGAERKERERAEREEREKRRHLYERAGYGSSYYGAPYRPRAYSSFGGRQRGLWEIPARAALVVSVIVWIAATAIAPMLTNQAIYKHYGVESASELPEVGEVRVMPKQVAEQLASAGWNSPTEKLVNGHIIRTPQGDLAWSFEQAPSGTVRHFTQKTQGAATLDAETTERKLALHKAQFEVSPNVRWTDRFSWKAYKTHFFTEIAEEVFIVGRDGEPLLIVPYLEYEGFPVRVPVLGGVYVVHPDGEIEDLSPEQAAERPEIAESGRLFPESLARRIMDSYKYKNGIWNRLFVHREQTEIADNEDGEIADNPQPYLMDFGAQGTKWVATAQPYGRSHATNGVFITDTITGETELWQVPEGVSLTGNTRAVEIVRGLSIPGINFDTFDVIEPRPLFIGGKLMFLVSVIPNSANTVTKSVIVDAERSKVVAIFNHDTDPNADRALADYIHDGTLPEGAYVPSESEQPPAEDEQPAESEQAPEAEHRAPQGDLSDAELEEILRELDEVRERQDELIEALRARLGEQAAK